VHEPSGASYVICFGFLICMLVPLVIGAMILLASLATLFGGKGGNHRKTRCQKKWLE
jgi:hydrogenase/urease accessory protein HupE